MQENQRKNNAESFCLSSYFHSVLLHSPAFLQEENKSVPAKGCRDLSRDYPRVTLTHNILTHTHSSAMTQITEHWVERRRPIQILQREIKNSQTMNKRAASKKSAFVNSWVSYPNPSMRMCVKTREGNSNFSKFVFISLSFLSEFLLHNLFRFGRLIISAGGGTFSGRLDQSQILATVSTSCLLSGTTSPWKWKSRWKI